VMFLDEFVNICLEMHCEASRTIYEGEGLEMQDTRSKAEGFSRCRQRYAESEFDYFTNSYSISSNDQATYSDARLETR
jgi:hypothetical protein